MATRYAEIVRMSSDGGTWDSQLVFAKRKADGSMVMLEVRWGEDDGAGGLKWNQRLGAGGTSTPLRAVGSYWSDDEDTTGVAVTLPSRTQEGDTALIFLGRTSDTASDLVGTPAGWTMAGTTGPDGHVMGALGTDTVYAYCFWREGVTREDIDNGVSWTYGAASGVSKHALMVVFKSPAFVEEVVDSQNRVGLPSTVGTVAAAGSWHGYSVGLHATGEGGVTTADALPDTGALMYFRGDTDTSKSYKTVHALSEFAVPASSTLPETNWLWSGAMGAGYQSQTTFLIRTE